MLNPIDSLSTAGAKRQEQRSYYISFRLSNEYTGFLTSKSVEVGIMDDCDVSDKVWLEFVKHYSKYQKRGQSSPLGSTKIQNIAEGFIQS